MRLAASFSRRGRGGAKLPDVLPPVSSGHWRTTCGASAWGRDRSRPCARGVVRRSGLWNVAHVDADYEPAFLGVSERLVREQANLPKARFAGSLREVTRARPSRRVLSLREGE